MFRKTLILVGSFLLVLLLSLQAQPKEEGKEIKERIIYIPYQKLDSLVQQKEAGIYLPYQDYRKLMEELERLQSRPPELPTNVVISHIQYNAKLVDKFLQVEAIAVVNVLKTGWHTLSLPFGQVALQEAKFNDKPALLQLRNDGYELIFQSEKLEKHELKLHFVVPVKKAHTLTAAVEFQVPRAPIANLSVEIPLSGEEAAERSPKMKVEVVPSLLTNVDYGKDVVRVQSLLGNTDRIQIQWQFEVERKVEIKSIVHAENTSFLEVGENFLHLQTKIAYDVVQGEVKEIRLQIPKDFRILSVVSLQGIGIRDWAMEKEDVLLVNLHDKMTNQGEGKVDLEIEIKLEQIIKKIEERFALPTIQALEVEREKGFYTVRVNDLYTLKILKREEISQIDIHDLPSNIGKEDIQFAFKYLKRPFSLEGELEKKEPEYEVITNIYGYLDETLYKLYAYFQYDIKKSRIFGTKLTIPSGFMILDVKVYDLGSQEKQQMYLDLIKEYRQVEDQGKTFLYVTFQKGIRSPKLVLKLHLQKKLDQEEKVREITLPVFQVDGAKREEGNIGLGVKASFNITTTEKTQKNVYPLDIQDLFRQGEKPPTQAINIGLRYFDHPIAANFRIEKRDPLVTAEVYNYVEVAENVFKSRFHIFYDVQYTGVKEFSFTLPEAIAEQVPKSRVTDTKGLIKEIQMTPDKEAKTMLYTINTQRDVLGVFELEVAYEKKLGQIETQIDEKIFELTTQNTKRENGFIVFKKDNNLSLDFISTKGVDVTDVNDPTFVRGDKKGILALFKYNTHGYDLQISLKKLSFEQVLNTVINRLHISTTVNKDYTAKSEAVLLVINNRKQMLEFEVPEESRVTSVSRLKTMPAYTYYMKAYQINECLEALNWSQSDSPRRFKVNIATNVQKNAPFVLVIKYESNLKKGEMEFYGDFTMRALEFVDVPVTHFTWGLGLPTEYQYVWFRSNLVKNFAQDYGTWAVMSEIFNRGAVDSSEILQESETGVIPIYPMEGKRFSFYRLNGNGYITVTYLYNNWLYTLDLAVFLLVCALIALIPKTKIVNRLTLVFFFLGISIILASLNLQGFQELYITVLVATLFAGTGSGIISFFQMIGARLATSTAKAHSLYRDKEKASDKAAVILDKEPLKVEEKPKSKKD